MDDNLLLNRSSINSAMIPRANISIYCFICSIAYKSTRFVTHYTECKMAFQQMPLGKKRPVKEHELFLKILSKLEANEDFLEDLNEYHEIAEELNFNLLAKKCPNCNCEFLPEVYLTHADYCLKKVSQKQMEDYESAKMDMKDIKKEIKQKIKRKSSMDNLKTLTEDEIKGFKTFNIRHIRSDFP